MLLTILKVWFVALAWLCYSGWGLTRLVLPPVLRPVRPLVMPLFGYALTVVIAYYLLWLGIALDQGRWLVLALATAINVVAVWQMRRSARVALAWPELALGIVVASVAGLIAVLPLLAHGLLAPIGDSWDVEFYLPLAAYLRHYPYAQLSTAPPNPLLGVIQADPTYVRAIGFVYFQGIIDSFADWEALRTFSPLLGLMRLLAAPAVFLFARYGLRLGRSAAVVVALLVALNELLLWLQYTGFAMHVSSMPLIPLTLLLTLVALRDLQLRSTLAAGMLLAALATSYHPGLLGYGALASGAGLWYLARGPQRWRVLAHGGGLVLGAAAATWLVHLRAGRAFFQVYAQGALSLELAGFVTLRTLLGLTPLASVERPVPPPWGATVIAAWPFLIWLALGVAVLLALAWLWRGRGERGLALLMLGTVVLYALGLRSFSDDYGYMKGMSFVSFLLIALVAGGLEVLTDGLRWRLGRRVAVASALALLLLIVGATTWDSYTQVRRGPALYGRERLRLTEIADQVPPGASVMLTGAEELRGPPIGLLAYALRTHPLLGRTSTGYAPFDRLPEGSSPDYGVLAANEDPANWGFDPEPRWRSKLAALYAAPAGRLAHLHGQPAAYSDPIPSAFRPITALGVVQLGQGTYRPLTSTLELAVDAQSLRFGAAGSGTAATRHVVLAIGTLAPGQLTVSGGLRTTVALTAGLNLITLPALETPATIQLQTDTAAWLRWAELYADPPRTTVPTTAVIQTELAPTATGADLILRRAPARERLQWAIEIYEDSTQPTHYGWGTLPTTASRVALDLATQTIAVDGTPINFNWAERRAGRYFVALWIYQGQHLLQRLPLLRFRDTGSTVEEIGALPVNASFLSLAQPAVLHNAQIAEVGTLLGTTWTAAPAGQTAQLAVWWQALGPTPPLLTTAQLLDAQDRKWAQWDGLLGSDAAPSGGWQPGEIVRQDIPLALDPALPPGRYRLLIGVYQPDGRGLSFVAPDGSATPNLIKEIEIP